MAYSINPNLPKARGEAVKQVIKEGRPPSVVARRFGINPSTLWRWIEKWRVQNQHIQLVNLNRPSRQPGTQFRWQSVKWDIPTQCSAPKTNPGRIAEWIIERILAIRDTLGRCATIIWVELVKEGITVSVSTISRVIARNNLQKTKRRKIRRTLPRPDVKAPGDLVEIDTVHYVDRLTGERRYIFTVIDLYSRMSYGRCFERLLPGCALETLLLAEQYFGFRVKTVQSDNGPEFSRWFSERLHGHGAIHRHTRIHRPNDNAHIERFNRTLREECIGDHMSYRETTKTINQKLEQYIDYYNGERLHLGIQCRVPRGMLRR